MPTNLIIHQVYYLNFLTSTFPHLLKSSNNYQVSAFLCLCILFIYNRGMQYAPSKLQPFLNKTRHFDIMWGIGEPSMHRCLFLSSAPASFCPKYPLQHPLQGYMYEQLHSVQYTHIQARQVIRKPFTNANAPFFHIL